MQSSICAAELSGYQEPEDVTAYVQKYKIKSCSFSHMSSSCKIIFEHLQSSLSKSELSCKNRRLTPEDSYVEMESLMLQLM